MSYFIRAKTLVVNYCEGIGTDRKINRSEFFEYAREVSRVFQSTEREKKEVFLYIECDVGNIINAIETCDLTEFNNWIFPDGKITEEMVNEENRYLDEILVQVLKEAKNNALNSEEMLR